MHWSQGPTTFQHMPLNRNKIINSIITVRRETHSPALQRIQIMLLLSRTTILQSARIRALYKRIVASNKKVHLLNVHPLCERHWKIHQCNMPLYY